MNRKAVDLATKEYELAAESLTSLRAASDFATIEKHWVAFLGYAGRVFTKLEQGSKQSIPSMAWWGTQVQQWKNDPLLRYVRHARNVNEHTLQEIAQPKDTSAKFVEPTQQELEGLHKTMTDEKRPWTPLALMEVVWAHVACIDVVDRSVTFPVPTSHLGITVTNTTPNGIGELALSHLKVMLAKANELVT